jgi:ArsR family transcriptional regulator, arsenate/arsenite/antimonite-responsive transcriptional repressor / arsenate reductase (thioredoxin)
VPTLHWSVADPVEGGVEAFAAAFVDLTDRIDRLARAVLSSDVRRGPPAAEPGTPRSKDLP